MKNKMNTNMHNIYLEVRSLPHRPPAPLAADIARHMQSRQYLGATIVVCDSPHAMLSAVRKQWLKAARHLQTMRASTLNAEEILRLTHAIMHMQNMLFVAKPPQDNPDAAVYFVLPEQLGAVPYACYSLYLTLTLEQERLQFVVKNLPQDALVINYNSDALETNFLPKKHLEEKLLVEWQHMAVFLEHCGINSKELVVGNTLQMGTMDNALDALLAHSSDFLQRAAVFQRTMSLAQPLHIVPADQQRLFEVIIRLAHRVQSLSPGTFNSYLVKTFGDKEATTYFLRDIGSEIYAELYESSPLSED